VTACLPINKAVTSFNPLWFLHLPKKLLLILSILANAHLGILKTVKKKVGIADKTDFTNVSLLGYEKKTPLPTRESVDKFLNHWMQHCSSGFLVMEGEPKVLTGEGGCDQVIFRYEGGVYVSTLDREAFSLCHVCEETRGFTKKLP
jgi:hypothetical protein